MRNRWLAAALVVLALGAGAVAVLGPLWTGLLVHRTSPTTVNQLFAALASATDYPHPAVYEPARAGEVRHSALDARRAGSDLGWKPWTTLEEGLAATLRWAAGRM